VTLPPRFATAVVGVSFVPGYPETLVPLEAAALRGHLYGEPALPLELRRAPANAVDPNAVEVHGPAGQVGHLPAPLAARLAPELDSGVDWRVELAEVRCDPAAPERPGVRVRLWRPAA